MSRLRKVVHMRKEAGGKRGLCGGTGVCVAMIRKVTCKACLKALCKPNKGKSIVTA